MTRTGPLTAWRTLWRGLRALSGDDAYERYLRHHAAAHGGASPPLSRREFYIDEQRRRWGTINRCC